VEVNRPIKAVADWLRQFALDIVYG